MDFDYHLPKDRIAQVPLPSRDESRLMVVHRKKGYISHSRFHNLVEWLEEGDLLVVNDTRVIPARLMGRKPTGGKVEVLLSAPVGEDGSPLPLADHRRFARRLWECLVRGKVNPSGTQLEFQGGGKGLLFRIKGGRWVIRFHEDVDLIRLLERTGRVPLPPYIKRDAVGDEREALDRERYQTIFARHAGSVAAPTAGLHFSQELLGRLREKGVRTASLTLHVGIGTFMPVRAERVEDHNMAPEYGRVDERCCAAIRETRERGGRVVAVGTTTVRALESAAGEEETVRPFEGLTHLFIYPGYRFRVIDSLITNFHLPRSTLLMLVYAFGGRELMERAYRIAVKEGYRFYSYGDAMLIV